METGKISSPRRPFSLALLALLALAGLSAHAEPRWEVLSEGPVAIEQRSWAGSPVTEVRAVARVDVSVVDLQEVVLDCASYPRVMPYVKECREVSAANGDSSLIVYTRVAPPLIDERDYVLKVKVHRAEHPGDRFFNSWVAVPHMLPEVKNVVRLKINEGGWQASPLGEKETRLEYRLAVEPGAGLSPFFARMTNRKAVDDLFEAVIGEARRRAEKRAPRK